VSVVVNANEFIKGLEAYEKRFHLKFRNRVSMLVTEGMLRLLRKTPVHTGQAVMNYVASVGTPYGGSAKQAGEPVEATNRLRLGQETLRGPAERVALATLSSVSFADPYKTYFISNNAPHIGGLEYGSLPGDPYTPRSPAGMFGVTLQELKLLLASGKI
jgi:hypothetical protein